ncbi:MAG TPA: extracellular solute-binding protein [Solirubrobacteraceae bacterium]|nr:extracellular solute-binding protein [Solirubrobacteraceae bacterium]
MGKKVTSLLVAGATAVLVACGGGEAGSGSTLTWFIFNEPSGVLTTVAERCSEQSNGRYRFSFQYLPADADSQREQLVRRLAARDDTIDIIGMDVIWTGEFANAGWIRPVPRAVAQATTEGVFDSVVETARFEDRLFGVPIWSNTQLLWYRRDRVARPPQTWEEMIDRAEQIGPQGTIQLQANRYEGLTVWANAMIESAGTSIVTGPQDQQIALRQPSTERALALMGRLSRSPAAAADLTTSTEDSARLGFESGNASFMVNYPFVFPSAEENAPEVARNLAAAKYPRVDPSVPSAPPLGGINLGVSSYSQNSQLAFEAIRCLVQPANQIDIAEQGGLPPVLTRLYDRPEVEEVYPGFADLIRQSIEDAAPRPGSPAYQDLSLAVQRALHPTTQINPRDPTPTYQRLRERVEQAIERRGLL